MTEQLGGADVRSTQEQEPKTGGHALPDGAPTHPLVDLSRDPNPGKADHAKPDEDDD
ncbi:hypothetical protein [Labedaea rhizosphaerae]|jgi:hypothetical protein|uniref:Uncharacterized protein n=1 Tax=Labedaea rhizosphaerae TaxID=598644 RepID=A0A4R6SL18_LABRH|nr:hypothetical protein [Labedaea rhizosphaerae]TDQ04868.1 hypothetical protein EV186_101828 [Labedaea rhizosphaerae]